MSGGMVRDPGNGSGWTKMSGGMVLDPGNGSGWTKMSGGYGPGSRKRVWLD